MKSLFFVLSFLAAGTAFATNNPPAPTNSNTNQATGGKGGQGGAGGKGGSGGIGVGYGGKSNARAEGGTSSATGGQSTSGSTAQSGGNSFSSSTNEVLQRNNTPSLGSVIVSPTANCQVVHGGGVSVPGFGVNVGTSTTNAVCELIELSKQLKHLGLNEGATQLMCQEPRVAKALGHVCHHSATVEVEKKEVFVQERVGG